MWMSKYEKFRSGRYTIICRSDYRSKLNDLFVAPDEFIGKNTIRSYMTAPNLVAEVALKSGDRLIVKSFGWRSKLHFLLSPFRTSKAMRSFKVAMRLLEYGIGTPEPLCVIVRRFFGFVIKNIYITKSIDNYITVREYLQDQPEGYRRAHEILPWIAKYVKKIHDAGIWHRDLHLTNFLMKRDPDDKPVFYIVDLNRARLFRKLPYILRIFDVGKMDFHEFRADFINLYLEDVNDRASWERIFYLYVMLRRIRRIIVRRRRAHDAYG